MRPRRARSDWSPHIDAEAGLFFITLSALGFSNGEIHVVEMLFFGLCKEVSTPSEGGY